MALNPNIALSFRKPQLRSPLETYGRAQQIAANAMAAEKLRNEAASVNALREYINSGGKLDTAEGLQGAIAAGATPDTARAYSERLSGLSKAQTDAKTAAAERIMKRLPAIYETKSDEAWQRFLTDLAVVDKDDADEYMRLTGGKFNDRVVLAAMAGAKEYFQKKVSTPVSSVQFAPGGEAFGVTVGGVDAPRAEEVIVSSRANRSATPTAPVTTPPPSANPLTPMSFSRGAEVGAVPPLTTENAPQIIQAAAQTGMIDETHLQQLRQMVGPENDQALANWMTQNNVRIQPTGEASMRSAVYRPFVEDRLTAPIATDGVMGGAPDNPLLQRISNEVGTQFRGRDPMQSPMPGSAMVPLSRVAAEAAVQRESPQEVYAKTKARARAEREAALEAGPKPLTPVQEAKLRDNITKDYKSAQSTIDMMLNPVSGVIAAVDAVRSLTPEQKEAVTGFSAYAPSIAPSSRQADTKIKNLKGKVTEMGKAAASLTGAIGQMAVQEWRIVSDMIASLDLEGMEPGDLDDQLQIIESQARRAAEVTQDAYENQYVEEFARYPNRFQLKTPSASAAKTKGGKRPPLDSFFKGR